MKQVIYMDEAGYLRISQLRDQDDDSLAPSGIPVPLIDLDDLDWDEIKISLHNALIERNIFTFLDVQETRALPGALVSVLKPHFIALFKNLSKENKK